MCRTKDKALRDRKNTQAVEEADKEDSENDSESNAILSGFGYIFAMDAAEKKILKKERQKERKRVQRIASKPIPH